MPILQRFTRVTSARTRAARYVLEHQDMKQRYLSRGGREADLRGIISAGERAEALNAAQGQVLGKGYVAGTDAQVEFRALQVDYNAVMAVLSAVAGDLQRAGAARSADLAEAKRILKNEAGLLIRVTEAEGGKASKVSRTKAQEPVRGEIWRDAGALLDFNGARAELDARGLTVPRLRALKERAEALSGKLAERTSSKAASKEVTAAEAAAVTEQNSYWGGCYRLLALASAEDPSFQALLKDARGSR